MSKSQTTFLTEPEGLILAREYGIPYPEHRFVQSAAEAEKAAREIGLPVVLKIVSPQIVHKSDAGGVKTGLKSPEETAQTFTEMTQRLGRENRQADIQGALICRQAEEGLEVIIGGLQDPVFGPVVMFGMGGIFAEVMADVAFRVAPINRQQALAMVREIKGFPLLKGLRGGPKADINALAELLVKVSEMMADRPEISELDLNPVRVYETGAHALDVRVAVVETSLAAA